MTTTVKGLNEYQKQLIVHIVALDNYTDEERAEHLKALDFCTDDVKRQVLMELERTIKQICRNRCPAGSAGRTKTPCG